LPVSLEASPTEPASPLVATLRGAAQFRPARGPCEPARRARNARRQAPGAIETHRLRHGTSLALAADSAASDGNALTVVVGGGRGCVLRCAGALAGLWIPLRGGLHCSSGSGDDCTLLGGELRVSEGHACGFHVVGRGNALWIAVLGTREAWRGVLAGFAGAALVDALLLPAVHIASRELKRSAVSLARAAAAGRSDPGIETLLEHVLHLQSRWTSVIARCPGRTHAQRRQVFLRLQRVRNYVRENSHLDIDGIALARMANFSRWHFIRAFRAAYEETPHAFLVDQRLRRARRLLTSSTLAISEIALAIGFESRAAFSRLFRQRFGTTARDLRRVRGSAPAQAHPA
jgi:AraC family transcriptional regulator